MNCGKIQAARRVPWPLVLVTWFAAAFGAAEAIPESGNLTVPPPVLEAEARRVEVMAQAARTAIAIFGGQDASGGGSGVLISPDGYALTNYHVAQPCGTYLRCGMSDGRLYDAVIVGADPTGDVALIKLLGRNDFPFAPLGDSDQLQVGQWCFAVGNPFLLATDYQPTITYGIVSGVHRYQYPAGTLLEYTDCIQTDAAINPGNSGGPLFDSQGQLVGVNGRASFEKRGRVNVGVGYAISINQVKNFLGHLHSGRIVDHATLGASVSGDEDGRVVVTNILPSSDAYRRGLRYGDEIVALDSRPIDTVNAFKNILGIYPRGWRIGLSYRRDGRRVNTFVRLAGVHRREELLEKVQEAPPDPNKPKEREPAPGDRDPQPDPEPHHTPLPGRFPAAAPLPEDVASHYIARRGYANYFFNRWNRDRVWQAACREGDFQGLNGAWLLEGTVNGGQPVQLGLDQQSVTARMNQTEAVYDMSGRLNERIEPPGSGGLFTALFLWRRLLTMGPEKFGDMEYLGTAPLPHRDGLFDVLVGTFDVAEVRFYFDRSSSRLVALEMVPDSEVDPCEIYFDQYRPINERQLPCELEVKHGDTVYAVLHVEHWVLPDSEADGA